jgi:hypothetical protein
MPFWKRVHVATPLLFVMENNKSSADKSDNNHGKWRDTKNNGKEKQWRRETVEKKLQR